MPESKSRKKKAVASSAEEAKTPQPKKIEGNPAWLVPTMVTLLILGVVWVVVYYLTSSRWGLPLPWIGQWNLAVGFALMLGGLGLATRWR
ncbi:cell division protein CrgA [Timonella senegalensis]|uniref:cell division protein CrgA n=1 Tax=Timonella senegalensis TaxID=1465825 RepID=UPI0002F60CE8|nr:cell division protein CrgA [Timonella senegalensis]